MHKKETCINPHCFDDIGSDENIDDLSSTLDSIKITVLAAITGLVISALIKLFS
jgi:hypothetical protein